MNVGPAGTHIGILTFSTQKQTKVLLELGEKQDHVDLLNYLDSVIYSDVSGDGTRMGMALKIVDEVQTATFYSYCLTYILNLTCHFKVLR